METTTLLNGLARLQQLQTADEERIRTAKTLMDEVLKDWFGEGKMFTEDQLAEEMSARGAHTLHVPYTIRQAWFVGEFDRHPVTYLITQKVRP